MMVVVMAQVRVDVVNHFLGKLACCKEPCNKQLPSCKEPCNKQLSSPKDSLTTKQKKKIFINKKIRIWNT